MEKINTKQKLDSLNIIPQSEITCSLCNLFPENASHLLLHCHFASSIWNWWCETWSILWVWPISLEQALEQWIFPTRNKFFKKVWSVIFLVISMWSLWKERNERVKPASSIQEVKILILLCLCWWIEGWQEPFTYSPEEVLRNSKCLKRQEETSAVRHSKKKIHTFER